MSDTNPAIRIERIDNAIIATCLFDQLSTEVLTHQWLNEILDTIKDEQPGELILDFTKVTLLTSYAIQKLIDLHFLAEEQQFKLALCITDSSVHKVFKMTCLDRIFMIDDNIQKIRESFTPSPLSKMDIPDVTEPERQE